MAFGLELTSKIFLTFARIVAVGLLVWALTSVRKIPGLSKGFVIAVALITAGAAGNIFDCVFYGVIFVSNVTLMALLRCLYKKILWKYLHTKYSCTINQPNTPSRSVIIFPTLEGVVIHCTRKAFLRRLRSHSHRNCPCCLHRTRDCRSCSRWK